MWALGQQTIVLATVLFTWMYFFPPNTQPVKKNVLPSSSCYVLFAVIGVYIVHILFSVAHVAYLLSAIFALDSYYFYSLWPIYVLLKMWPLPGTKTLKLIFYSVIVPLKNFVLLFLNIFMLYFVYYTTVFFLLCLYYVNILCTVNFDYFLFCFHLFNSSTKCYLIHTYFTFKM